MEVWVHIPVERLTSALISDSLQSHLTLAESLGGDVEFCRDQEHVRRQIILLNPLAIIPGRRRSV